LGSRSEKQGDLEVYDLSGRMVLNLQTQPGYQIFNLDVQQLTRGMYIIRRFESGELVGTSKFIKTE
ncbi:MAG: T9SS type A sorting domain-containing protein, partial [Bacteroides sp.]|nr:T9SS type A sorting domain-containing protein [Bacteroides sp.]